MKWILGLALIIIAIQATAEVAESFEDLHPWGVRQMTELAENAIRVNEAIYLAGLAGSPEDFQRRYGSRYDESAWTYRGGSPYANPDAPLIQNFHTGETYASYDAVLLEAINVKLDEAHPRASYLTIEIIQVLSNGLLARNSSRENIFIEMNPSGYIDGDPLSVAAYEAGTYRYTTVRGAVATVARYKTVDLEEIPIEPVSPQEMFAYAVEQDIDSYSEYRPRVKVVKDPEGRRVGHGSGFNTSSSLNITKGEIKIVWGEYEQRLIMSPDPR